MKTVFVILSVLLTLMTASAGAENYSCVVAKKKDISVVLLDDSGDSKHRVTLESVTLHKDATARIFRIHDGVPWLIPVQCKKEMEKKLTAEEISLVNMKISQAK